MSSRESGDCVRLLANLVALQLLRYGAGDGARVIAMGRNAKALEALAGCIR